MVRHFSTIVGDFFDTVFDFDSRIVRTIGPLLLRPGHLTLEYFRGHRVRYVSPVRLFFFLCIASFLLLRFSIDAEDDKALPDTIEQAENIESLERQRDATLRNLDIARTAMINAGEAVDGMDASIEQVRETARRQIEWLKKRDASRAAGETFDTPYPGSEPITDRAPPELRFNDAPWHPQDNPISFGWLPERANSAINRMIGRAQTNLVEIRHDRTRLIEAFLQTLPQSLFVLVPVFALVLKLFYLFTPRLYMEHLIVVLHSHAFLCAILLLAPGLMTLAEMSGAGSLLHTALLWLSAALLLWVPIYLLLMQKRVYGQNWLLTLVKFALLGQIHFALAMFGLLFSLAVSLVVM